MEEKETKKKMVTELRFRKQFPSYLWSDKNEEMFLGKADQQLGRRTDRTVMDDVTTINHPVFPGITNCMSRTCFIIKIKACLYDCRLVEAPFLGIFFFFFCYFVQ